MIRNFRESNKRLKALEEEKEQLKAIAGMPTPPPNVNTSTPQHLQPKSLFTTPQSSTGGSVTGTPQTPGSNLEISDIDSLSVSSDHSSVTPDMSKLCLGRGRGRPRKQLVKPTFEDFPLDASEEDQKKYIKKKRTEMWRYNKLCSSDASQYRQSELERVRDYQKKKNKGSGGSASKNSGSEHKKQLSRAR